MPLTSEPIYLSIDAVFPGQLRYSSQNVEEKKEEKISSGEARWNSAKHRWDFQHHGGKSLFSPEEAFPVTKAPFGYVLIDGHHHVLASFALKAPEIPVRVAFDFSHLSETEFWNETEQRGLTHLYNLQGQRKIPPRNFELLEDDPNRYFARLCARKFAHKNSRISSGAEYPIWIKIGKHIPFIEFKIADILWEHGLIYDYKSGQNPSDEFVENVRKILKNARIPGLQVIEERTHYSEIILE
jgi:hypothetical protein